MTRPSPHDSRALCPACNVVHHVRLDGLMRLHRYPGFRDICDGSHRPPTTAARPDPTSTGGAGAASGSGRALGDAS